MHPLLDQVLAERWRSSVREQRPAAPQLPPPPELTELVGLVAAVITGKPRETGTGWPA